MRLVGLGSESYWFDEIWAVKQSRVSLGEVLAGLRAEDVHPPLWPLMLHGWLRLLGEGEAAVRLLPALLGTATVPLFAFTLRRLQGGLVGLLGGALLAVHPYAIEFSQEARAYALLLLLSAALLWITVTLLAEAQLTARRRRNLGAAWALVAALLLYTHVFGALVDLGLGLVLLAQPAHRKAVVAAGVAALALYAPWVPSQLAQIGRVQEGFWIPPLTWTDPVRWLWHWSGYSTLVLAVSAPLVAWGYHRASPGLRRLAGALTLAVVVLPGLASLVVEPFFQPKYAIVMLLVLIAGVAVALRPVPRLGLLAVASLLAVSVVTVHAYTGKEQYRELAALGDADAAAGATLLTEPGMAPYVSYYLRSPLSKQAPAAVQGDVTVLLAHPTRSPELEGALAARCAPRDEVQLVLARAVRFTCPSAR